ncbi:Mn2+ and Fe2+ transporters of the NRAMP family [Parapedobacter luteus]|uniref:Mn2+ and Fe2+ transporters of the NRAMP family n=1 Tax=Parapedobacter luteus TaxID=623280 RepID=A0A1T5EBG8_9SPHI|nr:Nramp family divalent metal transporter [Parapedobacter luteus]SKB81160.1 Mn2+ and Fe2+ transporters of the NRAMP family [Parapedobacter luteus]
MKGQYAQQNILRNDVHDPPTGKGKAKMLGPGIIWMVSSIGTGQILFTPRIAARYEYSLLWMSILVAVALFFIIREVGRFTVVSGRSITNGLQDLPRGNKWGIWLMNVPQLALVPLVVAGAAALLGSVLAMIWETDIMVYALIFIIGCGLLVLSGSYSAVEKGAIILAALLIVISAVTAIRVLSSPGDLAAGLGPSIPDDFEMTFVMPWVGFFLAGASGILWYSYWVGDKEFGGTPNDRSETVEVNEDVDDDREKLAKVTLWMRSLGLTSGTGILLGTLVNVAFMILGAELLASEDDLPEGADVVEKLTQSLEGVWGPAGYWAFLVCVAIALGSSILANQDGGGRMFSDAARLLFQRPNNYLSNRNNVSKFFIVTVGMVIPLLIYIIERDPVKILSLAGIISAIQIPVIVFFTFYLNKKLLPKICQPSALSSGILLCAGLFYSALAIIQVVDFF